MASQICIEHQMAAPMMTSHPLEMTSESEDVTTPEIGGNKSLKEEIDDVYARNKEDISKEIEEVKDRDQRWENDLLQNINGAEENVDGCVNSADNGDNNEFSAIENDSELQKVERRVELRRKKDTDNDVSTSTLRRVKLNCDRQSVQYKNSDDFSPVADSPDGDGQTVVTSQNENNIPAGPEKQHIKILINSPRRKHSVDNDTLVIEKEDIPKTHLENFSKS